MLQTISRRIFCVLYLLCLVCMTPFCTMASVAFCFFKFQYYTENYVPENSRRKILITGDTATKAIHIIRSLGKAGHTIIVADWVGPYSVLRWSKYVSKVYSVPPDHKAYVLNVIQIALSEKVDYFIPVIKKDYAMADVEIGKYLTERNIKSIVYNPSEVKDLDDKFAFMQMCRRFCLSIPDFIDSEDDLYAKAREGLFKEKHYFMKPSSCSSVFRHSFEKISSDVNEIQRLSKNFHGENIFAQEYITGKEWAANLIAKNGKILQLNISHSSPIQVNYNVAEIKKIQNWVSEFCRKSELTGAVCFDFIEDYHGDVYCLECNPRFHSSLVTYLYSPDYERCILSLLEDVKINSHIPIKPDSSVYSYWFYQELVRVFTLKRSPKQFIYILRNGHEALWDASDPIPYFAYHHAQIPMSLLKHIWTGGYWECVNFCLGRVMY